jgi:phosphonate transport system permease protein
MSSIAPATNPQLPPRVSLLTLLIWGGVLALLAASWQGADMRPAELWRDSSNMAKFAADFFPPNFTNWRFYLSEMLVTL